MKKFTSSITGKVYAREVDRLYAERQHRGMSPELAAKGLFVIHPGTFQFAQNVLERQRKMGIYGEKTQDLGAGMSAVEKIILTNMRRG